MRILLLSILYRKDQENELLKLSKIGLFNQGNTWQWNLIEGIESYLPNNMDIINVLPVGTYPRRFRKLFLPDIDWKHSTDSNNHEIGCINIAGIKQHTRKRKVVKLIKQWKKKYAEDDKYILIYSIYEPYYKAVFKAAKNIKLTAIIEDLPDYLYTTEGSNSSKLFKYLFKKRSKRLYNYFKKIDGFVFLSKHMREKILCAEKDYTVIEGIVNDLPLISKNKNEFLGIKKLLYTGTYNLLFGIKNLLDAFDLIKDENYELWLCGSGEADGLIKERHLKDSRIKNFGYVSKKKINELQAQATVLINPRQDIGKYTRYSFPSKTMEYMSSSKPIICYCLDGIPQEYYPFFNSPENNSAESLKDAIIKVISNYSESLQLAQKAAQFVLQYKNGKTQAEKLIRFMQR